MREIRAVPKLFDVAFPKMQSLDLAYFDPSTQHICMIHECIYLSYISDRFRQKFNILASKTYTRIQQEHNPERKQYVQRRLCVLARELIASFARENRKDFADDSIVFPLKGAQMFYITIVK